MLKGSETMSDLEIIKTVFGILLTLGSIVLWFIAFKLFYKYLIQEKKCTDKVTGTVRKYTVAGYGGEHLRVHLPVVFYRVNGEEYKVVGPEYKLIKTISIASPRCENSIAYEEKNQVLTIKKTRRSVTFRDLAAGSVHIARYIDPISEMYPLNSGIDVYYDPENPKLAYVKRYCNKKWAFWLTFLAGLAVLAADIAIQLL